MDIENTFFSYLSERLRNETHLSDITWALCSTSELFKQLFLEYCFDEKIENIVTFEREYFRGNCRLDFFIEDSFKQEYLIEVKIYDLNDHIKQYNKTFPKAKKSFISNYTIKATNGWKIKTWKEFYLKIEKELCNFSNNEKKIICNYLTYLKSVLNFVEVKPMDLSNISSLVDFYETLKQLEDECKVVKLNEYKSSRNAIDSESYGIYFWYEIRKNVNFIFWIGLYLPENKMYIYVEYKKERCPEREAKILKELKTGKYHDKAFNEGPDTPIWIPLKNKYYKQLCEKIDIKTQKNIIKSFLEEILLKLK